MGTDAQLRESLAQLKLRLEEHSRLLGFADVEPGAHRACGCGHKALLKQLLAETVFELEKTRSSFKSGQIEQLRKKFIALLAQLD